MSKAILLPGILLTAFQLQAASAGAREDISTWAGKMLDQTNQARTAIKNGASQQALTDVNKAESDLQQVESRAHGSTMIPVYQEFVSVSILRPVQAEQKARKGAVVHEVSGDYTSVVVNTTVAKNSLAAARQALERNDLKQADSALADVQEGVEIRSSEADMPVVRARENLILARSAARNDKYGEAETALQAASKALARYEQENGPHATEAKALQQQISDYASKIQKDHSQAVSKINGWWNETADWSPYKSS